MHGELLPPTRTCRRLRLITVAPRCGAAAKRLHRGAAPLPLPPVLLVAAVAVMRLRRVVEGVEDISGRSPRDERWASADSWCVSNSRAMATCNHAAVAAPEGSEDEEDEEVHCASTGRPASLAAGAWSSCA